MVQAAPLLLVVKKCLFNIIKQNTMNFQKRFVELKDEATEYIKSVLLKRGTNYELIDPASYEEDGSFDESVYDLPRHTDYGKYNSYEDYSVVVVNMDVGGELVFECIQIYYEDYSRDLTVSVHALETLVVCQIADLIYQLENGN
jgi:hypothetical protein